MAICPPTSEVLISYLCPYTMKILSIFGTRPEAIKMAPVIKGLERRPEEIQSLVCGTAQHREMLDQVLTLFEIKPDYDLNIMAPDQDLFGVTCNGIHGLKPVLEKERPDLVLVQGDTTTTMPMQKREGPKVMQFLHERPLLLITGSCGPIFGNG